MDTALDACQQVLTQGSRSFRLAQRLMPRRLRAPAAAVYAFCRHADDAVDNGISPRFGLALMRARLDRLYAGPPPVQLVDRALRQVIAAHGLPRAAFEALLEGLAWDAAGRRYSTLSALQAYCARVASSVGVLMTILMGVREVPVLARACDLGLAMQLTNIARDVAEDAAHGRLYLPLQWLEQGGLRDPDAWLAQPTEHPAIHLAVQRLLSQAALLYRRADAGIPHLPADCRVGILAARLFYSRIGVQVAAQGHRVFAGRAVVSPLAKAGLALRALTARARRSRPLGGPAQDAYLFLLSPPAAARAQAV